MLDRILNRVLKMAASARIGLGGLSYEYAFLLSTMRSGSSLLSRLLNENSEIYFPGELRIDYSEPASLDGVAPRAIACLKKFGDLSGRYVMDKSTQPQYDMHPWLLHRDDMRFMFLIREPYGCLSSLIDLGENWSTEHLLTKYSVRLDDLCSYARLIDNRDRCFFLTYQQLTTDSVSVLDDLGSFLGLKDPLTERYRIARRELQTAGDRHSGRLETGMIQRQARKKRATVPRDLLDECQYKYNAAFAELSEMCTMSAGALVS